MNLHEVAQATLTCAFDSKDRRFLSHLFGYQGNKMIVPRWCPQSPNIIHTRQTNGNVAEKTLLAS